MRFLSNLSVKTKLLGAFLVVSGMLGCVSGFALYQLQKTNNCVSTIYKENLLPISQLGVTREDLTNTRRAIATYFASNDASELAIAEKSVAECKDTINNGYMVVVVEMATTKEEQAMVAEFKSIVPGYLESLTKILSLASAGKADEAKQAWFESQALGTTIDSVLEKEIDFNEEYAEDVLQDSQQAFATTFWTVSALIIGIVLLSMMIGWYIARWFTRAVLEVASIADDVASASQQLASAAGELSSGAQEQASSLEETASSLEEITSTIQQNADNAQQANQLAGNSRRVAENGGEVVSKAVQGMGEINTASKRIADIITAIDEIAFQTNLLALNAAVEAARAGEQGRGFAVVAGEVRNLAQRSAGAAKEIKSLIQDSVGKVSTGSELVNESGRTLGEIVTSVKRVTDIVSEIAAASREQASGIEQVNRAVTQMDQVVQTNAAQTEELSATAEQLSEKAVQLQAVVSQFNLTRNAPVVSLASRQSRSRMPAPSLRSSRAQSFAAKNFKPAQRAEVDIEKEVEKELEMLTSATGGSDGFQSF